MNAPVADSPKLVAALPYLIEQDWAAYTPEQHAIWSELVSRRKRRSRGWGKALTQRARRGQSFATDSSVRDEVVALFGDSRYGYCMSFVCSAACCPCPGLEASDAAAC